LIQVGDKESKPTPAGRRLRVGGQQGKKKKLCDYSSQLFFISFFYLVVVCCCGCMMEEEATLNRKSWEKEKKRTRIRHLMHD
jgi:hypothetical protein